MGMTGLPSRASDAGPLDNPLPDRPEQVANLASEYIDLYLKAKREARVSDPRRVWMVHLREAQRLLDLAETMEIEG